MKLMNPDEKSNRKASAFVRALAALALAMLVCVPVRAEALPCICSSTAETVCRPVMRGWFRFHAHKSLPGEWDWNTAPQTADTVPDTEYVIPDTEASVPDTETAVPDAETAAPEKETPAPGADSGIAAYEAEVIRLVNDIRARNGLNALAADGDLCRFARVKSRDMRDNGYFSHDSPTYGTPFQMMKSFGVAYRTAGENIAFGYTTPQAVVDGWMNSEGHRANILNASYTRIGVGYVADGHYWTQWFVG